VTSKGPCQGINVRKPGLQEKQQRASQHCRAPFIVSPCDSDIAAVN